MEGTPVQGAPHPRSPYAGRAARHFWRGGVGERHAGAPGDVYIKKFVIAPQDVIVTAGSCFAQHIARRLRAYRYNVVDDEPAPPGLSVQDAGRFGFGLYSARYGNIYTTRQLLQLAREATGRFEPQDAIWRKGERFYDALRPAVEPDGLETPELVAEHRAVHLRHVRGVLRKATVFVFTLGLTEAWVHRASGTVYPTAPGTIAGSFDPAAHAFKNFDYTEVLADFLAFRAIMRAMTPGIRFVLTVSPVPLAATATNEHVLAATTYSKSVLRAAAGHLSATCPDVDYFPSYEIIAGTAARGMFYENNLRGVSELGVDVVMKCFFAQHAPVPAGVETAEVGAPVEAESEMQVFCEEELLDAFAQ